MRTTLRPMIPTGLASTAASTLMLGLVFLPIVLAHGGPAEKQDPQSHGAQDGAGQKDDTNHPPSYFSHPEHAGVMLTHIALMTLAWVIVLPAGKNPRP